MDGTRLRICDMPIYGLLGYCEKCLVRLVDLKFLLLLSRIAALRVHKCVRAECDHRNKLRR